jgi:hypothetical protein
MNGKSTILLVGVVGGLWVSWLLAADRLGSDGGNSVSPVELVNHFVPQTGDAQDWSVYNFCSDANCTVLRDICPGVFDIPGTEKTVFLPRGKVLIQWDIPLGAESVDWFLVPLIGDRRPAQGLAFTAGAFGPYWNGSWVTHVPGGETTIKFQIEFAGDCESENLVSPVNAGLSWTLTVFPTERPTPDDDDYDVD